MAGTKRSCPKSFSCFSSCASDEEGQHPPALAGPRNSPSAIDNTTVTHPGSPKRIVTPNAGSANVVSMKYESGQHVDLNRHDSVTHQCGIDQLSESQNRKSDGEDVNAHFKVSGLPRGHEPSSSGSSKVLVKSEGKQVDVNPIVPETQSDIISSIKLIAQAGDVNLDELMAYITKLLKLREQEMLQPEKASNPSDYPDGFHWPDVEGLQKLKEILSWGTDLRNLKEMISPLFECVSTLKEVICGPVATILKDIGRGSAVTAGLLVVAYSLERFHDLSDNKQKYWDFIKEMSKLAEVIKLLKESPNKTLDVIEEATALLVEGAIMCCAQIDSSWWKRFFLASKDKADLKDIKEKLNLMYLTISVHVAISNSSGIERVVAGIERVLAAIKNPLVSRKYPEEAVGIDEAIDKVVGLLEIESEQKAVTVILHGFGGMGKTTLADAVVSKDTVVSKLVGFKYSKVRMSGDSAIVNLQKNILEDLMEPGEDIEEIRAYEDGQRELLNRLKKVQAFIYIDDVLDEHALKKLLPEDMGKAKKVRLLLTARNEDVKNACPRPCTEPKIYKMEGIQHQEALRILKRQIKDGINESQFNDIIHTCGGIPLMLTSAAKFIGYKNIEAAYSTAVLQKNKWPNEVFGPMHRVFAYEALPGECKEPFLDLCSFFKGWAWETVEDILGKNQLEMLERRALVTRTANEVVFVHDVILTLAHQKSKEISEGKEVRLAFTSASKLTKFLEEEDAEGIKGIKGIWLSDNKDALQISAATLDLMSKSLRVLRLGDLANVEGKCRETFKELVFFEAKVRQLPFHFHDLSKLKKLRYLSYVPNDELKLSKMPSSLRHMEFDGTSLSHAFQMYPSDLQQLKNLRILRLLNFSDLKTLPKKLGDQVQGLHELSLSNCRSITKLPNSISKLQCLRILRMDGCKSLTELPEQPVGLCNLSSITHLSFEGCKSLKELPDWFGQLASLKALCFRGCTSLQKLPESFGQLQNLEVLDLGLCGDLRRLCDDFHCLSSLQNLDLNGCINLEKLPLDFHGLTSLQHLDLSLCNNLEGESMNHLVNMNALQLVDIRRSEQLVERWAEIQKEVGGSWSFTAISGQDLSISRVEKENIEKSLLSELDGLLTNRRGEQFHLSGLPPNTLILVLWYLQPDSSIEDMIDETEIKIIYIGPDFGKFSTKVKDNIFVVNVPTTRATQMLEKVHLTLDLALDLSNKYLQIETRMQVGDEYRPCWRFLTYDEMEEFVVSNCKRYLRLKELQAETDEESSNIELLRELFAAEGDETTPVFQKNESSVGQDPTANSEVKATCGVDKLEDKTILLEMRPPDSLFYDIRLPSLKEMYRLEKERHNFEIISIPLVEPRERPFAFDVYKQFSREVPWLVLQNPWTAITREVQYFLAKHCTGWEEGNECEKWYPTINLIIDPNGRITIYRPPISPGDMRDRGEVFEVFFNYLERQSYQVTWGVNAPPPTWEKIEEVRKNEWQQLKNMSTLEFLFNHLESVSVQVKSLMLQGKFICLFSGSFEDEITCSIRSAMEQFRDSIHFIHFIHELRRFPLENISKEYYHPLENTSEMEGTSLLNLSNLSRHETVRFIMRLDYLEQEMNGMDQSDQQLCELKSILPSVNGSFTFFNEVGKMVAAFKREDIDQIQRLINSMLKEGGKEMHDEDSLIKKMQTE